MIATLEDFRAFRSAKLPAFGVDEDLELYSPYDDVHSALVEGIKSVKAQLVLAMYGFDDDEIAQLIAQKMADPDIHVQITLDKSQAGGVHEKRLLTQFGFLGNPLGNTVAIGTSEHGAIMHRKMLILDGRFLISGSTNLSASAETKQDNQLHISSNLPAITRARIVLDLEHAKALNQMRAA